MMAVNTVMTTGVIDHFTEVFTRYIDSGFGLLGGEVGFLASTLIAIDVTLAGIFWAWGAEEDVLAHLEPKQLELNQGPKEGGHPQAGGPARKHPGMTIAYRGTECRPESPRQAAQARLKGCRTKRPEASSETSRLADLTRPAASGVDVILDDNLDAHLDVDGNLDVDSIRDLAL